MFLIVSISDSEAIFIFDENYLKIQRIITISSDSMSHPFNQDFKDKIALLNKTENSCLMIIANLSNVYENEYFSFKNIEF